MVRMVDFRLRLVERETLSTSTLRMYTSFGGSGLALGLAMFPGKRLF